MLLAVFERRRPTALALKEPSHHDVLASVRLAFKKFPFLPVSLFTVSQFTVTQFTVSVFTVSVITVIRWDN